MSSRSIKTKSFDLDSLVTVERLEKATGSSHSSQSVCVPLPVVHEHGSLAGPAAHNTAYYCKVQWSEGWWEWLWSAVHSVLRLELAATAAWTVANSSSTLNSQQLLSLRHCSKRVLCRFDSSGSVKDAHIHRKLNRPDRWVLACSKLACSLYFGSSNC